MSLLAEPITPNRTLADCRAAIQSRLASVRRSVRLQLLVEGITWALGITIVLVAVSILLDRTMRPDLSVRTTLLIFGGLLLAFAVVRQLRDPVSIRLDDLDLAELLERRQKGLGQRLTTVLQLP